MPDSPQPDAVKNELRSLLAAISARAEEERQIAAGFSGGIGDAEFEFSKTLRSIATRSQAEAEAVQRDYEAARSAALSQFQNDDAALRADYREALAEIERQFGTECQAAQQEKADASWMVSSVLDDNSHESPRYQYETFRKRLTTTKERLQEQHRETNETAEAATEVMAVRHQLPGSIDLDPVPNARTAQECEERFDAAYRTVRDNHDAIVRQKLSRLFSGWRPLVLFILITGLCFAPLWLFLDPALLKIEGLRDPGRWQVAAAGASAGVAIVLLGTLFGIARSKSGHAYLELQQALAELKGMHKRWGECAKKELVERKQEFEKRYAEVVAQRDRALAGVEAKAARRVQEAESKKQQDRADADKKYPAMLAELAQLRDKRLGEIDDEFRKRASALAATSTEESETVRRQQAQLEADRKLREETARDALAQKWRAATSGFLQAVTAADQDCRRATPEWSDLRAESWKLPEQVSQPIRIGRYDVDFGKVPDGLPADRQLWPDPMRVAVPFILPFPGHGSLLFECQGEGRAAAVDAIRSVMLRLLAALPGGKIRFTVIDPAGLGEEFSAFMHLADFDELMIGTRIWTEKHQIEKRLTDLSQHMENVFQAYLRNEFETIEEYNEQAGEVAEPYQFLIVANFPSNFSDSAAQRLVSIATSGPRCGVYTLISVDMKQPMPHNFDVADLEASATTLDWKNGRFVIRDPQLELFPVTIDATPRSADFSEIVRTIGRQSKDSRRVEVAFERIAPRNGEFWKLDSRTGLDVPLGRAGATKLQHLALGRGTSQHVMIAGKTGSGKSSLLHTLIVNLALHYSPDEVQFYLVDFKKGVEFKTYASNALPHARIIGIESDREFGISVLERLDVVLKERGDLFRRYGAQDVKGYRKARPDDRMPRILLIVDEFQEFFIEDDALSQAANLLLDRLVRQGRAFGIHVLLGSQTLGGAYSLARSTLGQVAVRIALQCSESDAHLILSEENSAARLLTRPGEAIYNDSNGLLEGNHPFQIAWLPDDRRDDFLKQVHETACARHVEVEPPIVFEGNVASDPRQNPGIVEAIEGFAARVNGDGARGHGAIYLWLGEAVSIKPPTRIAFNLRPGDNLLIVGQDAESAQGMLAVAFLTIAAQLPAKPPVDSTGAETEFTAQLVVLDGDAIESDQATRWKPFVDLVPHRTIRRGQRQAAATVEEIAAEVKRRVAEGSGREEPVFVFISNFSRFRDLRNEQDDFGFSSSMDEAKGPSAGKLLADIFRDGPAVGVHAIVWCDTYSNLNRWMTQQSLREFELRVAFQMNSADSSSLIDSPFAARLGGHRALLYLRETGTAEKLRPYAVPSADWLDWIAAQFQKNGAVAAAPLRPPPSADPTPDAQAVGP